MLVPKAGAKKVHLLMIRSVTCRQQQPCFGWRGDEDGLLTSLSSVLPLEAETDELGKDRVCVNNESCCSDRLV